MGIFEADMPLLYNVNHDPSERFNVADKHLEIVKKLTALAKAHEESLEKVPSQLDTIHPDFMAEFKRFNPNF